MLLVTGGSTYHGEYLASTEVYRPSAGEWREVPGGALPRPMYGVRVVTLNNRVLLFGEDIILILGNTMIPIFIGGKERQRAQEGYRYEDKELADILQFSDLNLWTKVGEMSKPRANHAVSIVDMNDFKYHCQ